MFALLEEVFDTMNLNLVRRQLLTIVKKAGSMVFFSRR
jgi:hypothetical protein